MSVGTSLPESSTIADQNGPSGAEFAMSGDLLYEVVDGQVVEKIVGVLQVRIAFTLAYRIESFAEPRGLGRATTEMIFRINRVKDLQRRPDAAFISDARWSVLREVPDVPVWDIVPDLAIEVVSPTNSADAVNEKMHEYFEAGVRQVWVVYTKRSEVYVYYSSSQVQILQLGAEFDGGELLPGFRLPLTEVFKKDEPEAE